MNITKIKCHLLDLETNHVWKKTAKYLYHIWEEQKHDMKLTTLLIQQMMMYILDIDDGYLQELHENNNGLDTNRTLFLEYLITSTEHALSHLSEDKYLIWQICYYLKYIYTYYPLLSVPSIKQGYYTYESVIEEAKTTYNNSLLFPLMDKYTSNDFVLPNTNQQEVNCILDEIKDFHLQNNIVDIITKGNLENIYGIYLP